MSEIKEKSENQIDFETRIENGYWFTNEDMLVTVSHWAEHDVTELGASEPVGVQIVPVFTFTCKLCNEVYSAGMGIKYRICQNTECVQSSMPEVANDYGFHTVSKCHWCGGSLTHFEHKHTKNCPKKLFNRVVEKIWRGEV